MQQYDKNDIIKLAEINPLIKAHIEAHRTTPGFTWESMLQSLVINLDRQVRGYIKTLDEACRNHLKSQKRLRRDCSEAYQVIGAGMLMEPCKYTQDDVERALDNLIAAANGDERPHDDLLPWPKGAN